ncbi:hypothetical protein N9954_03515 [Maribacter sp.]|nr:hypothetical protein [Maribacter sp.]
MNFFSASKTTLLLFLVIFSFKNGNSQEAPTSDLYQNILKIDAILFENGFNNCMLSDMDPYISEDLEFYHDQGGPSTTKKEFFETLEQNICSNPDRKPLRKLIESSVNVFPLYNKGVLYGAIQNGVHEFYMKEINKEAYLTSTASFTHLYIIKNDTWQLKRVLSYNHQQPKHEVSAHKAISLTNDLLAEYVGEYKSATTSATISKKDNALQMVSGEMQLLVQAVSESMFFSTEAPLTFEFIKNADAKVVKMVVRENGQVVEEIERVH